MTTFSVHTQDSAPEDAHEVLKKARNNFGFIPNLLGVLAEAPVAAEAYLSMIDLCRRSSMTPTERHVTWFAVNDVHECQYCMAAHTAVARLEEIPEAVIEAARNGTTYHDERLQILREFTQNVVNQRGVIPPEAVTQFLDAGFTQKHVLEIIVFVSTKVLSNYTNHIAGTPLDQEFSACEWKKPNEV
ncbi:hypothetical protein Pan241w_20080 [Gimesia alba]|uniref:Carboxymuconolactone decarboxylase family protein n=1 Tax=Gimesia alba TaxID=2527973 RepID=A0A517RDH8_9PLAN|nr:carboxymuconolactone decarboxylase family protein [Gimesia alba]QDT41928.1 hypothetical protein Pan241w_20080 [Gimesia alba]